MTTSEAREMAYGILGRYGVDVPTIPHALIYNRMSIRQREIFSWISNLDPDFYGECATAALVNGDVDLNVLEGKADPSPYPIESIQVVRVEDPGSSLTLTAGDRVRLVRADDFRQVPPRMTLRSMVLRDVGGDMAGVNTIKIWYTRRPRVIGNDGTDELELPEPWHDLIALDAAQFILQRTDGDHGGIIQTLKADEQERMQSLATHVKNAYRAVETRFVEEAREQAGAE